MSETISEIVELMEEEYDVKVDVEYDFAILDSEDVFSLIDSLGDSDWIATGEGWLINNGDYLELILIKRGVILTFKNPHLGSNQTVKEVGT